MALRLAVLLPFILILSACSGNSENENNPLNGNWHRIAANCPSAELLSVVYQSGLVTITDLNMSCSALADSALPNNVMVVIESNCAVIPVGLNVRYSITKTNLALAYGSCEISYSK